MKIEHTAILIDDPETLRKLKGLNKLEVMLDSKDKFFYDIQDLDDKIEFNKQYKITIEITEV